jgi:hypothetical protein
MGRVALLATRASELALQDAGLLDHPLLTSGRMGVSFGSSAGTPSAIGDFGRMMEERTTRGINATTYIKMMAHTAPVNIGVFFGVTGRVFTTSSACTSGSQGIGYAYEAIKTGKQTAMIAGGAEELCATEAAVFDTLFATSVRNDAPHTTPRPFDRAARRPGDRRGRRLPDPGRARTRAGARRHHLRGDWSASAPTATAPTSPSRTPTRCASRWNWRSRTRTWHRRPSATSTPTAPAPSTATWPRPGHERRVRRAHADQLPEELHGTHPGRLRRARSHGSASR